MYVFMIISPLSVGIANKNCVFDLPNTAYLTVSFCILHLIPLLLWWGRKGREGAGRPVQSDNVILDELAPI